MYKQSKDIKAGIWYTVGNFFNKGIAFISTPIFTRLLSKEDYGEFSNFTSWASLLAVITSLDLYSSISRAYFDYEDDYEEYMSTISGVSITFTALCYLFILAFKNWAIDVLGMDMKCINMLFIYLLFCPATQYFMAQQRVEGKYKLASLVSVGSSLASVLLALFTVLTFQNKLWGRIVGYVFPVVVVNIVIYGFMFAKGKKIVREKVKYALTISIPLIPHHLSGNILTNSDRIMIKRYCGATDAAIYNFAYNCGLLVSLLYTSINQAYMPWLFRKLNEEETEMLGIQGKRLLVSFLLVVLGVMLLIPEIVLIMGGYKYADAITLTPIIMLGCCYQFFYTFYVNLEFFCKRTFTVSMGTLISAGINLGLNIVLIPMFGYRAAAVTTVISYIALYLIHFIATRKLPYKDLYDHKGLVIIMLIFSVCCVGVEYLYPYRGLRYCIIAVYAAVIGYGIMRYWRRMK